MPRFVILHHQLPAESSRPSHWDLMLQQEQSLRTWAIAGFPVSGQTIRAEALANHRLAYLEYEGPISGGRGEVERVEAGQYSIDEESDKRLTLTVVGNRLNGRIMLELSNRDQHWILGYVPADSPLQTPAQ